MTERITGVIDRLSDAEDYNSISWILEAPVENIALSAVDDTMKTNADFQYQAGLESSVTRYTEPSGNWPCDWCQGLEGTYSIDDYPSELFMHHERCRCVIEWDNKQTGTHDTLRATTRSKGYWQKIDPAELERRKNFEGVNTQPQQIKKTDVILRAEKSGIDKLNVQDLQEALSTDEIVAKIGGADQTRGSCVSVANAYIGNTKGWDVTDYRGELSQRFFSQGKNAKDVVTEVAKSSLTESGVNDFTTTRKLLKTMEPGKEYYLVTGKHASIVRVREVTDIADETIVMRRYEYLELQASAENNGWKRFNGNDKMEVDATLRRRFGCQKSHTFYGDKYEVEAVLVDLDEIPASEEYREILGYLNTAEDAQMKGAGGGIK